MSLYDDTKAGLDAQRAKLEAEYAAAKAAGNEQRKAELKALAVDVDIAKHKLIIGEIMKAAADLDLIRQRIEALTQTASDWPFGSSQPAGQFVGTKPTPQTDDDVDASHEHNAQPGIAPPTGVATTSTGWRPAASLNTLLAQVNAAAPHRSNDSDGTIGDAAHQKKDSDHNPWVEANGTPIVTAIDITHDPIRGCDVGTITEALRVSQDTRIKYVIFNHRIFSSIVNPWTWRNYSGSNPHETHMHLSVLPNQALFDDTKPWSIGIAPASAGLSGVTSVTTTFDGADAIAWGAKVPADFKQKVINIGNRIQLDPSKLMAIMAFETGRQFKASTPGMSSSAVGLIQFMPSTATMLGTSSAQLAQMTEIQQLDYVEAYFKPYSGKLTDTASAYMAVLWPAAISRPEAHVLWVAGTNQYAANKGLDVDQDGKITKAEAASKIRAALEEGMQPGNFG